MLVYLIDRFKVRLFFVIAFCGVLFGSCLSKKSEEVLNKIKLIYMVVDDVAFSDAHIPGSLKVTDISQLESLSKKWLSNAQIIVYCGGYGCTSSHEALEELDKLGFSNVRVLDGGMADWYRCSLTDKEKYPIVGPINSEFLKSYGKISEERIVRMRKKEISPSDITSQELSSIIFS